ncbi:MAG: hypothetical protein J6D03_03255 [Clostridia bacterium]|nr:hypothetical protein [Clostridia bacterium]
MKTMNNNITVKTFNYEAAINGAEVVTRLGRKVKVIAKTNDGKILCRILGLGYEASKWNIDGSKYSAKSEHFEDLFLVA